ncbi:MAG: hypothetical protein JJE30_14685 [Desulfuromonadales bacterium]|nr:hypothetical protein [Desulfuromonadales bacterium]
MIDMHTEMKIIRVNAHLNVMDRDLYDLSQVWDQGTEYIPGRIGDLQSLVASMKGIIQGIIGPPPGRQDNCEIAEDLRALCRCKEIESDPQRQAAARALAKKKMVDMAAVGKVCEEPA